MVEKTRMLGIVVLFLVIGAILWNLLSAPPQEDTDTTQSETLDLSREPESLPDFEFDVLDSNTQTEEAIPKPPAPPQPEHPLIIEDDKDALESAEPDTDKTIYASISGRVINKLTQQPITDFSFYVYYGLYDYNMDKRFAPYHNNYGQFTVSKVKSDESFSLRVRAKGYADLDLPLEALSSGTSPPNILVSMDSVNSVVGQVVDERGNPIAQARIFKGTVPDHDSSRKRQTAVLSDEEGYFTLEDLSPGEQILSAYYDQYLSDTIVLYVQQGENEIQFVLGQGAIVEGRVKFNRKAIPNASIFGHVQIEGMRPQDQYHFQTSTDEKGYYRAYGVPDGIGSISVTMNTSDSRRTTSMEIATKKNMVTVANLAFDSGNASLEGYIMLDENTTGSGYISLNIQADDHNEYANMDVGNDGYYRFTSLPAGQFRLSIRASDSPQNTRPKVIVGELSNNENLRMDFPLYGGAAITCRIQNPPANSIQFAMLIQENISIPENLDEIDFMQVFERASDMKQIRDNTVSFDDVHNGSYTIVVLAFDIIAIQQQSGQGFPPPSKWVKTKVAIQDKSEINMNISF